MKHNPRRSAFTLIEMLVSMALILFIMVIISQCFATALDTFRGLKGIGDMQGNLRTAETLLRSDLMQDHFEGRRKLSDPNITTDPRPREGFFFLRMGPNLSEGADGDTMPSLRSPQSAISTPDAMYFTIKLRGNRRENFLSHRLPFNPTPPPDFSLSPLLSAGTNFFDQPLDALFQDQALTYNSQWAEVLWYLERDGSTVEPGIQFSTLGTPLWALYRAQYLLVPNNLSINANNNNGNAAIKETTKTAYLASAYGGVACYPNANLAGADKDKYLYFNSPADTTVAANRTIDKRLAYSYPTIYNATRVLGNVVSFHVRPMPSAGTYSGNFQDYYSLQGLSPPLVAPSPAPAASSYDSSTATYGVRAVQIIIRVWDPISEQSRQVSIVQDL